MNAIQNIAGYKFAALENLKALRVGLDPSLRETANTQCFVCWIPLTEENQRDAHFAEGKSCPYYFVPTDEQRRSALVAGPRRIA